MKKNPFKILWMITGFICLCLGTIGVILPILPTVPFYMATAFCFAKSSERLHGWFVNTGMYQKHLASFVERKAMTMKTKCTILTTVTIIMAFAFVMMKNVLIGRICRVVVWIFHILYFFLRVGTIKENEKKEVTYD